MESLHRGLSEFAPYFGMVAAILALGSWLCTNYFGNRANSSRDALREAKGAFDEASQFRLLYGLVNEETQNLDQVHNLLRSLAERYEGPSESDTSAAKRHARYDRLKRLEYARHGDRAVRMELERADQLLEYAKTLKVGKDLRKRATAVSEVLRKLTEQRRSAHEALILSVNAVGDVYDLGDKEWDLLTREMERYRNTVEIDQIPALNEASRNVADLQLEIVGLQTQEAVRRRKVARVIQRIAFTLFVVSALLALYGKWLEAKYPKRTLEPDAPVTRPAESGGQPHQLTP